MAASYKKTSVKIYPRVGEKITRDTLYWKNLEFPITRKEFNAINYIDFSPVEPYSFATTSGGKVQVISCDSNQVVKTFAKFRDNASGGSFRGDGKLLVAGGSEGLVRLFDVASASVLRIFKGHTGPVNVSRFTSDNLHILSGSDDNTVRLWDIATESELIKYAEHKDYVRCGATSQASKDIVVTGSYDHTVKLWDARTPGSVMTAEHGQPVDSVLMYPTGGIFISAGGNVVKVWDALAGGKLVASFSNHHKSITCMCLASDHRRLVSGSLDRHVKIYDISTYQVVHTLDYPSAILSVGVAPDDSVIAVGMADGLLSIQHRKAEEDSAQEKKRQRTHKASYQYKLQSKTHLPSKDDVVVDHKKKEQLAKYDRFFKRFEHTKALDAALDPRIRHMSPEVTVSVMQELIRRGGIKAALAGRDEKSLGIILKFLQKHIARPKFASTILDVTNLVLELYMDQTGQNSVLDVHLEQLKQSVDHEVDFIKQLMEVMGTMDTLFAATEYSGISQTNSQAVEVPLKTSDTAAMDTS